MRVAGQAHLPSEHREFGLNFCRPAEQSFLIPLDLLYFFFFFNKGSHLFIVENLIMFCQVPYKKCVCDYNVACDG